MTPAEHPITPDPAHVRRVRIGIAAGVSVLVIALVLAVIATRSSDDTAVQAASTTAATTPTTLASADPPGTTLTEDTAATVPATEPVVTTPATEPGVSLDTTVATAPPSSVSTSVTTPPTSSAPRPPTNTAPTTSAPVKAAPVTNCAAVGTISIPATGVNQSILAERKAYSDGLLCGNHASDHVAPGVDILPGFASLADSVAGGATLQGQVPAIIFGHRNSHNRPFLNNNKLKPGDTVVISNADGTTMQLKVDTVQLLSLKAATAMLLAPSADGRPGIRLVCCSHADGSPGGVNYRWIVTVSET